MSNPLVVFFNIVLIGFIVFVHYRMVGKPSSLAPLYFPSLLYKVSLGIALGLIYFFYYQGGDTIAMFEDGVNIAIVAQESPKQFFQILFLDSNLPVGMNYTQQPRALFFAKMISWFAWLTNHHYWLTSVYFSLISFFSIWYLCTLLVRYFKHPVTIAMAFLFYPSVVFWSAGIIKESIALAMICLIVAFMLLWIKEKNTFSAKISLIVLFLLCTLILWKIKYYYVAVLLPVVFAVVFLYRLKIRILYQLILMVLILAGIVFCVSWLHPNLHISYVLQAVVTNHDVMLKASQNKDAIIYQNLEANWRSLFHNLPLSFVSGLFRPLPGNGSNWLHFMTGLENLILMGITCLALSQLFLKRIVVKEKLLVKSAVVYIIILSVLLALSSPNFGTLMRYKVAYLPFLLYLGLIGSQPLFGLIKEKLSEKSQLIKKI